MKYVTFTNLGFLPFVESQYHFLKKLNLTKDYLVYFYGNNKDYEQLRGLGCEVRNFKSKIFNFNDDNLDMDKIVHCGESLSYNRFCAYKLESFFNCVIEFDKATYIDPDIAIFEDFTDDIISTLADNSFALKTYENTPIHEIELVYGRMVNLGMISGNNTNHFKFFMNKVFDNLKQSQNETKNFDEATFTDVISDTGTYALIDDKINILNDVNKKYTPKEIIGKTKSFHPTFYESKAKIDMLISLERWYNKVQRYTIKGN